MTSAPGGNGCPFSRRSFLAGAAAGVAVGVPLTWLALRGPSRSVAPVSEPSQRPRPNPQPTYAMPGPYPGRVIEVHHPEAVRPDHTINDETRDKNGLTPVQAMIERGMRELTGADNSLEAWRALFQRGDVVGIKVNPVGRKPKAGESGRVANAVGSISSPEVLLEIVVNLKRAGVQPRDIIVFERYAEEFVDTGYDKVMACRDMDGVRWFGSAVRYDDLQVDVGGFDRGRLSCSPELGRHVVGYDPDVFTHMGFCTPQHDPKDDRRFRSHLSLVVSRMIDKLITIPVLKDHRSAGVTLSLKNLSHGMNNNVARSHLGGTPHGGRAGDEQLNGPNQCNTFIPTAVAQERIRQKATLHILDGLIGVYEGGPGCWNRTWATWHHKSLFFATDPVALDHVGWDVIDAKRVAEGWAPVAQMGSQIQTPVVKMAMRAAPLAAATPVEALALAAASKNRLDGLASETFNTRQPEHIILAGALGLGVFDARYIDYRRINL